jgi:hypothetical protein
MEIKHLIKKKKMKFRKKPVVIDATQWFKNGDHPLDNSIWIYPDELIQPSEIKEPFLSEGKVVRYYRNPKMDGQTRCKHCGIIMKEHGWIDTLEGGHIVCPKDWVITGVQGEVCPCKPDIFESTYEEVV